MSTGLKTPRVFYFSVLLLLISRSNILYSCVVQGGVNKETISEKEGLKE